VNRLGVCWAAAISSLRAAGWTPSETSRGARLPPDAAGSADGTARQAPTGFTRGSVRGTGEMSGCARPAASAAIPVPPSPSTPAERLALWCDRLPSPAPEMLRTLAAHGAAYMDAEELAVVLGKKPSGGHWNSGIAVLRNNGLIETDGRRYRTAALFRK